MVKQVLFLKKGDNKMRKKEFKKPNLMLLTDLYKEDKNQLLTPTEAAEIIGVSEQKLANDRWRGVGVSYDKVKNRCYYRPRYILDHFRKNMHRIEPRS
jgi:hypothetical protein